MRPVPALPRLRELALSLEARLGPAGAFLAAVLGGLAFILGFVAAGGLVVWISVSGWRLVHPSAAELRPQAAPTVSALAVRSPAVEQPAPPAQKRRRRHRPAQAPVAADLGEGVGQPLPEGSMVGAPGAAQPLPATPNAPAKAP